MLIQHLTSSSIGEAYEKSGGGYRDRTDDLLTASQTLSQLS